MRRELPLPTIFLIAFLSIFTVSATVNVAESRGVAVGAVVCVVLVGIFIVIGRIYRRRSKA